jgi:3-phosphoshikimate 1-carboxyvinyltransferase
MLNNLPRFKGTITVPGDKSISHRTLILASQATGIVKISNLLESEDVFRTMNALKKFGIRIFKKNKDYVVYGMTVGGLENIKGTINCGNSGTTARLLMGLLASYPSKLKFVGDKSLSKRPMKRVINILREFGATSIPKEKNYLPFTFLGSVMGLPNHYKLQVPSAQLKSAFLLAALNTSGISTIEESFETRDHTEIMLKYLGAKISIKKKKNNKIIKIFGKMPLDAKDLKVPGDISSAAFMIVLGLISKNSVITIKNTLLNPTRTGILDVLKNMNAKIKIKNKKIICGEVVGDIEVKSSILKATSVPKTMSPRLIDEYPILFIAASFAKGISYFEGIEELRIKESDRIQSMEDGFKSLGIKLNTTKNSLQIKGEQSFNLNHKIKIDAKGDHRIAMSFYILSQVLNTKFQIKDFNYVNTSFPTFTKTINRLRN